ncbi:MAG: GNAT family N-acetyltransferase [Jatrophihabitans sp.]|uniref:GNAT family N-acetyltransferase n=1 Tax=Jatrophihabitans sp. TaxID=1932789 RepID=UPI003F7DB4FE
MKKEMSAPCLRVAAADETEPEPRADLIGLALTPWMTRAGHQPVLVRPSRPRDLPGLAQLHARCSARSLLDRYRSGGRPPSALALESMLRERYSVIAMRQDGSVVASAVLRRDPRHGARCAEIGVLVEDAWQRQGIGSDLVAHLAGVAQVAGFTELITYPATAVAAAQRLMLEGGRSRMVPGTPDVHLHTYLPENAALGLGSVRERLAG